MLGDRTFPHLAQSLGQARSDHSSNRCNGASVKAVLIEDGPLRVDASRDNEGSFEPRLIPKYEHRFAGLDDRSLAIFAREMTAREIKGFLDE
mgnify:CR=1 FL=1